MCKDWQRGMCHRGEKCIFDHPQELKNTLRVKGAGKEYCKDYERGICKRGDVCRFLHDKALSHDNVCREWTRGVCDRGKRCKFDHPEDLKGEPAVCRDFQMKGICIREKQCKFLHFSVKEEEEFKRTGRWPDHKGRSDLIKKNADWDPQEFERREQNEKLLQQDTELLRIRLRQLQQKILDVRKFNNGLEKENNHYKLQLDNLAAPASLHAVAYKPF